MAIEMLRISKEMLIFENLKFINKFFRKTKSVTIQVFKTFV